MKIIAVDADGTLWKNAWPHIGAPNPRLFEYLANCRKHGIKVILLTMREGDLLEAAVDYCRKCGLEFDAVNDNLEEMKALWKNNPRKVYADWYIDDHNAACGIGHQLPDLKNYGKVKN